MNLRYPFLLSLLALIFLSYACSKSYTGKADIGSNKIPELGLPFFTASASSNVTEQGVTQAIIFLTIAENNLIFKKEKDSLVSRINLQIEVLTPKSEPVISNLHQMMFFKSTKSKYYDQKNIHWQKAIDIPPGEYEVKISITDLHSGKLNSSVKNLQIPDPEEPSVFISNVQFHEKPMPEESYIAVNGYDVNNGFDSLKFTFQVTNGRNNSSIDIESKLIRFKADHNPARSMSGRQHRSSSLEYKGIDYTDRETIQSTKRTLATLGSVTIENSFADLPFGNYRFEVACRTTNGETFFEIRDFSIKSSNYPQLKDAIELARPLVYLMAKKEYARLMQMKSEDSLKATIDKFWLQNIKNVPKAKEIVQLYYERVEEANIQFGNYKEGWKTDPGMIYILFGPPLYVDEGFGEMTWFYEFDSGNPSPSIYFEDPQYGNVKFPFSNYILQRSPDLFSLEYRQIQSWTDGSILYLSQ